MKILGMVLSIGFLSLTLQAQKVSTPSEETIEILLFDGIRIHFNKQTSNLEQDSCFFFLEQNYQRFRSDLIDLVTDTVSIQFWVCYKEKSLRKGDIAFMLLDRWEPLPLFRIMKCQFDVIENGCLYMMGLFDRVESDRALVSQRIKNYCDGKKVLQKE